MYAYGEIQPLGLQRFEERYAEAKQMDITTLTHKLEEMVSRPGCHFWRPPVPQNGYSALLRRT